MTDKNTLADNNIKHFGKLSTCYQYLTDIDSESCSNRVCLECGNNHSFSGNLDYAIAFIDLLPKLFPGLFKESRNSSISTTNLQEFVN
jgi:hypothetical protein